MRIKNETRGALLADRAFEARGFWPRLVGLLGRASLESGQALLLDPCTSVHTAFMRFTIDVVYLDREKRVIKTSPNLKPFRASGVLRHGRSVIELPAGVIESTGTVAGDEISFES